MSNVTLDALSAEDKKKLLQELADQQAADAKKLKEDRKAYKVLVDETVPDLFAQALGISAELSAFKTRIFQALQTLVTMKAELFGKETDQYSHSFTTTDGTTLIIGSRYNDGWDATVTNGISRVNAYLESLGKDKESKILVAAILKLLSKDAKGNLKASRVLQLAKLADESGSAEFIDAVQVIRDAYRPLKTKEFVTIRYRGNDGELVDLPLDITQADFDFQMPVQYAKNANNTDDAQAG